MITCERCGREFPNKGCFSQHQKICESVLDWIIELDDDYKLKTKYKNKKVNSAKENIEFKLTYEEFCTLVKNANLISLDLGFSGKNYVLARIGDKGPYEVGNCRFITQKANSEEKIVSEKCKQNGRKSVQLMTLKNREIPKEIRSQKISEGIRNSRRYQEYLENKSVQISNNLGTINYQGNRNSQFGTYWITDGSRNMKWKDEKGDIPLGYTKGRVIKKDKQ